MDRSRFPSQYSFRRSRIRFIAGLEKAKILKVGELRGLETIDWTRIGCAAPYILTIINSN